MKKVLFATTALVATAGIASADISISGYAEIGLTDTGAAAGATDTTNMQLHQDVDVTFTMSGETDGGMAFGVSVDLDEAAGLVSNSNNGTAAFVSSGAVKLTVGNTDGAMDFAMTEVTGPGSITDNETGHDGFYGSYLDGQYDNQVATFSYSIGALALAVSTEILDTDAAGRSSGMALGAKYTVNGITLGVGHQTADTVDPRFGGATAVTARGGINAAGAVIAAAAATPATDIVAPVAAVTGVVASVDATGVSASGTFGALTAGVAFTAYDSNVAQFDADHVGVGFSYKMDNLTIGGNWGEFDSDTRAQDREGYGITANYALGGGAVVQAGYESSEVAGVDAGDSVSLGIAMSF